MSSIVRKWRLTFAPNTIPGSLSITLFQYFFIAVGVAAQAAAVPMRLGHVGNLSLEKGLELVLQTLRELLKAGSQVRLRLAGPCFTAAAERLVNEALREFPDHIEYLGPVYRREKLDFFSAIDCFLFPSRSESWGIVLNEAMAAGVPVISSRHGCISTQVGEHAGLVIDDPRNLCRVLSSRSCIGSAIQKRIALRRWRLSSEPMLLIAKGISRSTGLSSI